jgi:hypothetical protein
MAAIKASPKPTENATSRMLAMGCGSDRHFDRLENWHWHGTCLLRDCQATDSRHFYAEVTDQRAFTTVDGHQRSEEGELDIPPARGVGLNPTPTSHPNVPPARPKGIPHPFGLVHSLPVAGQFFLPVARDSQCLLRRISSPELMRPCFEQRLQPADAKVKAGRAFQQT